MQPNNNFTRNSSEFKEIVVKQGKPAILIFGAEWSGNSEIMEGMMTSVYNEYESNIHFFSIDVDQSKKIAQFFSIDTVPAIVMMKSGEVMNITKGLVPAHKLKVEIESIYADVLNLAE